VGPVETPRVVRLAHTSAVTGGGRQPAELADELVLALADQPRVLVCDLTGTRPSAQDLDGIFAPVARYLADWPGVQVIACADEPDVRARLRSLPFVDHLVVSASSAAGLAATEVPALERSDLHLPAHTTAPSAARGFVARHLREWRLQPLVGPASLVVSELVTNSVVHAATPVEVTLSRSDGRIQVVVRDHADGTPQTPGEGVAEHTVGGRGLLLVHAVSRSWGVFPARPRGKAVWAVLDETATEGNHPLLRQPVPEQSSE
jgi:anti-sigma regulatory factor (Ser/Thr protein kinase)